MSGENLEGQMSFLGLLEGYTDSLEEVKKPQPVRRVKPVLPKAPEQFKLDFIDLDAKAEAEHLEVGAPEKVEEAEKPEVVEKPEEVEKPEVVEKPAKGGKSGKAGGERPVLYKQCVKCWCQDCKHNSRGEGVPREVCGSMKACPACDLCVAEDNPTVCEIGNATEGCKLRAIEEGLLIVEEETIG